MIARGAFVDFLAIDGEGLVLMESGDALRLSAVATAIFEFLSEPRSLKDLRAHLEDAFGMPPQGNDLLCEMLETLVSRGVLVRSEGG